MLDARQISLQMGIRAPSGASAPERTVQPEGLSFKDMLAKAGDAAALPQTGGLQFSRHAQKRLASRSIELGQADLERLEEAVGTLRRKGARDSLVLMGDLALVVSVKNNTVITAVDDNSSKENVFTNIDSAVIAR
ncbi:MAG: hypothetical protein LBC99_07885 [Spirochaetota bacterium]|jgi:flagellar operon protein|nr:hypothetical protein [Spirochaetota bacterium]